MKRFTCRLRHYIRNRQGVAAVEFALIAPVLLLLLLAAIDVVPTIMANFKFKHASELVGDMAGQYNQMQTTDMDNVFTSITDLMTPYPSTNLNIRLSNIYTDGNGNAYIYWSCATGTLSPLTAKSAVTTTPTGTPLTNLLLTNDVGQTYNGSAINSANTSYIQVESSYSYSSPAHFYFTQPVTVSDTVYVSPRNSIYVGFPWAGSSSSYPNAPTATTTTASVTLPTSGATCNYAK